MMETDVYYKDILRNAVICFAVGDALGVPYEFEYRGHFHCTDMIGYGTHNQPPGTWSDDTSMMLAACHSLKESEQKIDVEDMRRRFLRWVNENEYTAAGTVFDIGHGTLKALRSGRPQFGKYSNGNGSLMRILPLAFTDCTDDEIRTVSKITHGDWISKEACVIYVNTIRKYLKKYQNSYSPEGLCEIIREIPAMDPPFDRLHMLNELSEKDIRSSGYVVDTLEAAFWVILQNEKHDHFGLKDCLLTAVNLGDDTDTVAAVTGGLAGLIYRPEEIPEEWINKLQNKELIYECLW